MTFLDKYPHCNGCPVTKWCGTAVASTRLCNSYDENERNKKRIHIEKPNNNERLTQKL